MHTTRHGTQAQQIRDATYCIAWSLVQTSVSLIVTHRQEYKATPTHPPDVSLVSASLITSTNWQTKTNIGSDHLPILISLWMDPIINPIPHRTSFNLRKANWDIYRKETEHKLSKSKDGFQPTDKKEKKSCVPSFWKQHHTIYPLADTILIQSRSQRKYWNGWEHEMTSDLEIPPRPPCNRWTTRSPEQQTNIGGQHGDSSWRHWTTGQTLQNYSELSMQ